MKTQENSRAKWFLPSGRIVSIKVVQQRNGMCGLEMSGLDPYDLRILRQAIEDKRDRYQIHAYEEETPTIRALIGADLDRIVMLSELVKFAERYFDNDGQ